MQNEKIIWQDNPSLITNWVGFLIGVILTVSFFGAIIGIPYLLWSYIAIKKTIFELTDERLIIRTGVLNKKIEEIELFRIRDFSIEKPFVYNLFNLGNITLTSSDKTNPIVKLNGIKSSEEVRNKIRDVVNISRKNNRVRDLEVD